MQCILRRIQGNKQATSLYGRLGRVMEEGIMREGRMSGILLPTGYFAFLCILLWVTLLTIQVPEPPTPEGLIPGSRLLNRAGR